MRRTIKVLLVALAIAVSTAIIPAVSASAATGPVPPSCSTPTCKAPNHQPTLEPKNPSMTVTPPSGRSSNPDDSGTSATEPASPPPTSEFIDVKKSVLFKLQDKLDAANARAASSTTWLWVMIGVDLIFAIFVAALLISNRRRKPQIEAQALTHDQGHNGRII